MVRVLCLWNVQGLPWAALVHQHILDRRGGELFERVKGFSFYEKAIPFVTRNVARETSYAPLGSFRDIIVRRSGFSCPLVASWQATKPILEGMLMLNDVETVGVIAWAKDLARGWTDTL
jgi:hypothetical protein